MATLNPERLKRQKKERQRFWIILTILELLLSVYLATLLDGFLTCLGQGDMSEIRSIFKVQYTDALMNLVHSDKIRMLFLFCQVIYAVLVIYATANIHQTISKVDTIHVTPDIEIPVRAGNGQHGNERFLTETEKEELFEVFEYNGKKTYPPISSAGVVVQMKKESGKEWIYYYGGEIHSIILGASGAGKTRRILFQTLWLQILAGQSAIISDVKGEIYYYTHPYAEQAGYTTIPFDLRNPRKGVHYNYMQPILDAFSVGDAEKGIDYTWDMVSVLVGEQKGEPLWYNGECATIAAAILIVALEAPEQYRNFTNVYYFLAFMCQADAFGNMPLNMYLETLPDEHPAKGVFAMATIAADRTRSSFFTSALGTLRLFTNPSIAEMTSKSDFRLEDISNEKTILYMMIPDEKHTLYPLVSILITQLYQTQVDQANKNGLRLPIDTNYNIDEVGNFPKIPVLPNIASAGRSRGVRMNLIFQDYQQGEKIYKEDFENIKTNCQLKIYLKSDSPKTLEELSKATGDYTVEVSSASTSVSDDKKSAMNYSSSASLTGRPLLKPSEIKRIKAPYSLCMLTGEYSGINLLPDLSEYYLNRLFGLGNKEHNAKIIMEREAAREEREVPPLQLWGIWKEFQEQLVEQQEDRLSFL